MRQINGKYYPIWSQFVTKKSEWIGGSLTEKGEASTEILNIILRKNGDDSAYFEVSGKEYSCGFDVRYGGIAYEDSPGLHMYSMYMPGFSILKKKVGCD